MDNVEQRQWIKRVLGIDVPREGAPPDDTEALKAAELTVEDMSARLQAIAEDGRSAGVMDVIAGGLREAAKAVQARSPNAGGLLDLLEQRIAELTRQRRMGDVEKTAEDARVSANTSLVEFAKIRLKLNAARASYSIAVQNLEDACEALLSTPSFLLDPRSSDPDTLAAVAAIGDEVPDVEALAEQVEDSLNDMANAPDPETRRKLADGLLAEVRKYRADVAAGPLLTMMENTAAGQFQIASELTGALDELASALAA